MTIKNKYLSTASRESEQLKQKRQTWQDSSAAEPTTGNNLAANIVKEQAEEQSQSSVPLN